MARKEVTVEFTRPSDTTGYSAGDLISTSTTAPVLMTFAAFCNGNVGGGGYIVGARLTTDKKSITPQIRVHLFKASTQTVAHTGAGDNAAMKQLYTEESNYIGSFDFAAMTTPADATNSTISRAQKLDLRIPFSSISSGQAIYAALESIDTFTPASGQKFSLTLMGEID